MVNKHQIRPGKEIEFADGKKRVVYPLTIKGLRKFVKVLEKMKNTTDAAQMTDDDIEAMIDASLIILEASDPEIAENREAVEDIIDIVNFNKMMAVAMGNLSPEE